MPFKPFAHLARVSFAKGLAHTYTPSVVVAGQSSYATTTNTLGQLHNYPASKFAKAAHLSHSFTGASGSSGAGAKAGYTTQASGGDAGLAQYYAAWQLAQQTGDDADWKQQQSLRRIPWKSSAQTKSGRHTQRVDSARAAELLRPSALVPNDRTQSENAAQDLKNAQDSVTEAEALARVDEAIAQEIKEVNAANAVAAEISESSAAGVQASQVVDKVANSDVASEGEQSGKWSELQTSTEQTSPVIDEADLLSQRIVDLGRQSRHADIPALFESMLRDGLTPTVDAYNAILASAISLSGGSYQIWPRALEVYGDMTRRVVEPNAETYSILVEFLSLRGLKVYQVQKSLASRRSRYGNADGSFRLKSTDLIHELYAGDNSVVFATKLYNVARAKIADFAISTTGYNALLDGCIKAERIEDMKIVLSDMTDLNIPIDLRLFAPLIEAHASVRDISAAQKCYEQYRDLAIIRASNDVLDHTVYAALIKAYHGCEMGDTGQHFYEKVLQSFAGAAHESALVERLTAALVLDALVPHQLGQGNFEKAIESAKSYDLTPLARDQAMSDICVAAADAGEVASAQAALSAISSGHNTSESVTALAAAFLRQGQLEAAKTLLSSRACINSVDLVSMYTSMMLRNGEIENGLVAARQMFEQVRGSMANTNTRNAIVDDIDETIVQIGEVLSQRHAVISSPISINLLRMMIENGGLVSPVAQHAVASLGPDCVHQLSSQDIALALHVQAGMLSKPTESSDAAHSARFAHLLETVLNRGISMDPSTVYVVSDALSQLSGARPDLEARWRELLQPSKIPQSPAVFSPILAPTPVPVFESSIADTFDPYAHNSDFRTSKIIEDQLESTVGRLENHLGDALSRFRNVRRVGRHLHYRAYAKLITAAGKTKQTNTMHEILGMAQADVPLLPQYASVKSGWVAILDSMVSACLTIGDRQLAAKFHQDLLDMGAAPSANTFGIYITTLEGTFDEATEAVKIFQRALSEGVEPSVFLYNAVIGKLGKARRIDDCLFYFGDMQAKNIRPSSVTYGTLVNALCRTSEERFAEEMFDEMESMPNYRPRAAPYNSIIQYFLNTKRDRSKVLAYYERMKTKNIKPTSHTYKLLIEAHASLEPVNLTSAEGILAEMKAAGVAPEAVHYGTLIHAKGCVMHDMAGARAAFDMVLAEGLIRPSDNLYQNLLESMVANHQVAQTDDVVADMRRRGVTMTPYIANTLIHGWAGEGDIDKAKTIYDSLGQNKREPSTYEAMTRAFLSCGRKEEAEKVVGECLRKGYPSAVVEKVAGLLGA